MFHRNLTHQIKESLKDTPVVLVGGPRQSGKSTLAKSILESLASKNYVTLDDFTSLSLAKADPESFVSSFSGFTVLDEVQRAPELFLAIKAEVDKKRVPGRFLLTGSADVLLLPKIADSLAGRIELHTLWPLSQGEIQNKKECFIDRIFSSKELPASKDAFLADTPLIKQILHGGFPEIQSRKTGHRRSAWFSSYTNTILQRDIRDLSNIEKVSDLPKLLRMILSRSSSLLNFSELSRSLGMPQSTLKRYLTLLETLFLVHALPAWSCNLGKRMVKSPKIYSTDTGLMASILGIDEERFKLDPVLLGAVLETFCVMELKKQMTWSDTKASMYHFRSSSGQEIDVILEAPDGRVVAIEIKSKRRIEANDFSPMKVLAEDLGKKFLRGIVLYRGEKSYSFGKNMHALSIDSLWCW